LIASGGDSWLAYLARPQRAWHQRRACQAAVASCLEPNLQAIGCV